MSKYIPLFYVDVITYLWPYLYVGLANLHYIKMPHEMTCYNHTQGNDELLLIRFNKNTQDTSVFVE